MAWTTRRWEHRIFGSLFGIVETNVCLAYEYFINGEKSHAEFIKALALELIDHLVRPVTQEEDPFAVLKRSSYISIFSKSRK